MKGTSDAMVYHKQSKILMIPGCS